MRTVFHHKIDYHQRVKHDSGEKSTNSLKGSSTGRSVSNQSDTSSTAQRKEGTHHPSHISTKPKAEVNDLLVMRSIGNSNRVQQDVLQNYCHFFSDYLLFGELLT